MRARKKEKKVCFRMSDEMYRQLYLLANLMGLSVSDLLRYSSIRLLDDLTRSMMTLSSRQNRDVDSDVP